MIKKEDKKKEKGRKEGFCKYSSSCMRSSYRETSLYKSSNMLKVSIIGLFNPNMRHVLRWNRLIIWGYIYKGKFKKS